jgi:hypothetical protein
LNEKTTATTLINDFIICSQKVEKRNKGDMAETKRHRFLEKITDDDYDVVIPQLKGETSLTFDQCVSRVGTRKQELESSANKARKAKSRRTKTGDEKDQSSSKQVPEIPGFINVRHHLMKWRYILNKEGRHITADEGNGLNKKKQEHNADSDHDSSTGRSNKKCNAKRGSSTKTRKARRTNTVESGTRDGGVDVRFKDRDELNDDSEKQIRQG